MIKNHIVFTPFSDWRFQVTKAEGSFLWDDKGKKYIDFTSGWNVTNLGWNHLEIKEAIQKQAEKNVYNPMWTSDPMQEEYAEELVSSLPKELDALCRVTGGTEANEEALKIARAVTGRKKFIGFNDSYHGQSFGTMGICYRPEYVEAIAPLIPDCIHLQFPKTQFTDTPQEQILADFLKQLETVLEKRDVAALLTEAGIITGWGSTVTAPKGYLSAVRELTKKYGTLLILDEVGTGFSRCGKLFGMEMEGVVPDIATFAKGISNGGAAIGAVAINSDVVGDVIGKTNLTSTFGWTPVACAAALATLKVHKRDKVWEQAEEKGQLLVEALTKGLADYPMVGSIHGKGMEIGITFSKDQKSDSDFAMKVLEKAGELGLHLVFGDDGTLQLMPPLTIDNETLTAGTDILIEAVKTTAK